MAKKIVISFIVIFIIVCIFIKPFSKLRELNMKNRVLTEKIEYLKKLNTALEKEANRLKEDLEYVERRAREKTGGVKEGEIIYKIPQEQ